MIHIQPGKPTQNAHVQSFHGRLRDECLNTSWFKNLFDARRKIAIWREDYNERRLYSALGYLTPNEFARSLTAGAASPSHCSVVPAHACLKAKPSGRLRWPRFSARLKSLVTNTSRRDLSEVRWHITNTL
jgi:putative transposase